MIRGKKVLPMVSRFSGVCCSECCQRSCGEGGWAALQLRERDSRGGWIVFGRLGKWSLQNEMLCDLWISTGGKIEIQEGCAQQGRRIRTIPVKLPWYFSEFWGLDEKGRTQCFWLPQDLGAWSEKKLIKEKIEIGGKDYLTGRSRKRDSKSAAHV